MEYVGKLYGKIGGKFIEVDDTEKLREENAALRAAIVEMERMLHLLTNLFESYPRVVKEACGKHEVPDMFCYYDALHKALEKINRMA